MKKKDYQKAAIDLLEFNIEMRERSWEARGESPGVFVFVDKVRLAAKKFAFDHPREWGLLKEMTAAAKKNRLSYTKFPEGGFGYGESVGGGPFKYGISGDDNPCLFGTNYGRPSKDVRDEQ